MDDVESAGEDDISNLMNDSDTKFIAEEEITQAANTQDTSPLHHFTWLHQRLIFT